MPERLTPFGSLAQDVVRRMGLQPQAPPTPRFEMTETVRAPMPPWGAPWPDQMTPIVLGSATAPPTGTYVGGTPKGMTPRDRRALPKTARESWDAVAAQYPYVAQFATVKARSRDQPDSVASVEWDRAARPTITVNPSVLANKDQLPGTLTHELTHVAQLLNYYDQSQALQPAMYNEELPHPRRPEEQQATAVESESDFTPLDVSQQLWQRYGLYRGLDEPLQQRYAPLAPMAPIGATVTSVQRTQTRPRTKR